MEHLFRIYMRDLEVKEATSPKCNFIFPLIFFKHLLYNWTEILIMCIEPINVLSTYLISLTIWFLQPVFSLLRIGCASSRRRSSSSSKMFFGSSTWWGTFCEKKQFSLSVIKILTLPGFNIYKSRQCKTQNQHYLLNRSQN